MIVAFSLNSFSQKIVSGTVIDIKTGKPIPGVVVLIKDTSKGTSTDFNGLYNLPSVNTGDVLVFRYLGYISVEKVVGKSNIINVILQQTTRVLDEVVLVGYGTARRGDLTGAISSIKSKELVNTATTNFDQAIAGRVAGVNVFSTDGTPGAGLNIIIRGGNSITGDNSPLYVIDGVPSDGFDPASISTNDIKSFDILKDASATAIYGSRAANGVILITTKQGRADGKTDVNISTSYSLQWIPTRLKVLSPYEYVKYQKNNAYALDDYIPGTYVGYFERSWGDPELYRDVKGTSWQDEIFRMAGIQKISASVSGGNKMTNLYFSSEYLDQEGTLLNSGFKKLFNNIRFSHKINNKTSLNSYLRYFYSKKSGIIISAGRYGSIIRDAVEFRPVTPINGDELEEGGIDPNDSNQRFRFNPVKNLENTDRQNRSYVIRGNVTLTHRFNENLNLRLSGSYNIDTRKSHTFYGKETLQGRRGGRHINGSLTNRSYKSFSSSNILTYTKRTINHRLTFLGGLELQDRESEYGQVSNGEIPTDLFGII